MSYSHKDEKWAPCLHRGLETYTGHKKLVGIKNRFDELVPERLFPIFRDRDELEGAADLPERIQEALRESRSLIVICSRSTATSKWVKGVAGGTLSRMGLSTARSVLGRFRS
jgi:hypothetical protein